MKKKLLVLMLAFVMVFAFAAPAMAADGLTHGDMAALVGNVTIPAETKATDAVTQEQAAAYVLLWSGMKAEQLGTYPSDWNAMALSAAVVDLDTFDPTGACTEAMVKEMKSNAKALYDAMHADKMSPLFINGEAQPIFPFTTGAVTEGYSNETSNVIRYFVFVETNYDTDGDGKLDLVKALVQVPRAAVEGDYKAATIYEARPYITGCTPLYGYDKDVYGNEGYDVDSMYNQPAPRKAAGSMTTMDHAKNADSNDWYYWNEVERIYDYEDLEWYDYYLVRGFAVVECGGIGTLDSEGFETCGTDLEIDAFKCVIEWLTGDRVGYTDKEKNITIKADWSNGKVGMTGRSYAGTTQFGLATTGVKGLETIVPVAGISSWYEYTNSQGIQTRSSAAYVDSLAGYCAGRYFDKEDWNSILKDYGNYLGQLMQDQLDVNGDYGDVWAVRDYTLNAKNIKCTALIVHGLYDYNVRTKMFQQMYDAFDTAGIEAKLLLHQDGHVTPSHPGNKWAFDIDGESYDAILNRWFSHYLYGVDNDAENMSNVTVQDDSNPDKWHTYDSWTTEDTYTLKVDADASAKTTISSDYKANGFTFGGWANDGSGWKYTPGNYEEKLVSGSTPCSIMFKETLDADMTIKGAAEVSFSATADLINTVTPQSGATVSSTPNGDSHEEMMTILGSEESGVAPFSVSSSAIKDGDINDADALMATAILVDIAPKGETFPTVSVGSSYSNKETIAKKGAWLGGGLTNYDYVKMYSEDVEYKIITRGWMDLCNPTAGFDSASAARSDKVQLANGKYYDYTIYLQPTVYTIEEGHTLALVLYTQDRDLFTNRVNYEMTVKDASVNAVIPLQATPYTDVTSDYWAIDDINYTYNRDIMNGMGNGTFEPETQFSRAMLATTLYRLSGAPEVTGENPFTDVADDEWYTDAIIWAAENDIVEGMGNNTFEPDTLATREQFATMMYRYAKFIDADTTIGIKTLKFDDADKVSDWAKDAMLWAVDKGLIKGMTTKLIVPQGLATRAQAATILARFDRNF